MQQFSDPVSLHIVPRGFLSTIVYVHRMDVHVMWVEMWIIGALAFLSDEKNFLDLRVRRWRVESSSGGRGRSSRMVLPSGRCRSRWMRRWRWPVVRMKRRRRRMRVRMERRVERRVWMMRGWRWRQQ